MSPELEQLRELYQIMLEKNLDALELKDEESRVKLTRRLSGVSAGVLVHHPAPQGQVLQTSPEAQVAEPAVAESVPSITAPLAGIFYRASSPNSAPFVKDGDTVEAGQTLCIVEAMKVMNEIKAELACKIVKILAENGRSVTAGQALFQIEPV